MLRKEFSQPSSATSGMAGYDLSDRYRPTRVGRSIKDRLARLKARRSGLGKANASLQPERYEMSQYQKMLALLKESVSSIATAPEADREPLLAKSFEEFEEALSPLIADGLQEAFALGMRGDLQKFAGGDDELAKSSISQVAGMATLMQSIENQIQYLSMDPDGDDDLGPDNRAALGAWAEAGKQILAAMVSDYAGAGEVETPADVAKFDADRQLRKDHVKAICTVLKQRAEEMLSKAEGDGSAAGASDGSDMDPLEVIGRLAAAILVQVDQLMPGSDQQQDDGSAAGAADTSGQSQAASQDASKSGAAQVGDGTSGNQTATDQTGQADASQRIAAGTDAAAGGAAPEKKPNPFAAKKPNPFAKADGAQDLTKADGLTDEVDPESAAGKRMAKLEAENEELRKAAGLRKSGAGPALRTVTKGGDDLISSGAGDDLQKRAEKLAKMNPGERTHELIKIAQAKPLKIVA